MADRIYTLMRKSTETAEFVFGKAQGVISDIPKVLFP